MARSGVYRSAHDLVASARAAGHNWTALLGVRPDAPGRPQSAPGVLEFEFAARGRAGVRDLRTRIDSSRHVLESDVVITLIPQSDVALAGSEARASRAWVAWVRGKPWPARGEQPFLRTQALRTIESRALRLADAVWATTPVLASDFSSVRRADIVPAGIAPLPRTSWGRSTSGPLVWAGRVDQDKRPAMFRDIVRLTGHAGRAYGLGPLHSSLSRDPVEGLDWVGWADSSSLWKDASIFVGTSKREAFGRSAVEAAASGVPIVIGSAYGAAPLLFTDAQLAAACVIDSDDPTFWAEAVRNLLDDPDLRSAVSEHVHLNARRLTIASSMQYAASKATDLWGRRSSRGLLL